ncbi:hypothetical protein HanIR_Chr07g0315901 [Helianthus annuus]|nr:hypothetical protein HanIR_Chr07g0315901 [Helianthus annuus]
MLLLEHRQHVEKVACFLAPNFLMKPISRIILILVIILEVAIGVNESRSP